MQQKIQGHEKSHAQQMAIMQVSFPVCQYKNSQDQQQVRPSTCPNPQKLQKHQEAEKFLKPLWDTVIDYFILVLVLVTVVCGVVALYATGPVCIPVLHCPVQGDSLQNKNETSCASIHNTTNNTGIQKVTNAVPFTDRNLFDYINAECSGNICWWIKFFPNILIVMAGVCLVCSNAWFVLHSAILEQFIDVLRLCHKYSPPPAPPTTPQSPEDEGRAFEQAINKAKQKMEKFIKAFKRNDSSLRHGNSPPPVQPKVGKFLEAFQRNDSTEQSDVEALPGLRSKKKSIISGSYFSILVLQTLILGAILGTLAWLVDEKMGTKFECDIEEAIPGLVYDHFLCSYSISNLYSLCAKMWLTFTSLHIAVNIFKLVWFFYFYFKNGE